MSVHCAYFSADQCRSCPNIELTYEKQLASKQQALERAFAPWPSLRWLAPIASEPKGFRNKAKMAVGGTTAKPTLGLVDMAGGAQDLADCLLYPAAIQQAFAPIKRFITEAQLVPYEVANRRGELKFVLLTLAAHSGELMVRFVLRSRESLPRIEKSLRRLRAELPTLAVISVNLQPLAAAIVEGPEEIPLSDQKALCMELNGLSLYLRPQGFFQTNTDVAAALYRQAKHWIDTCQPASVWDLYCGVGGFALHAADGTRAVLGIERSAEAVEAARRSARECADAKLRFEARDASDIRVPERGAPELIIVNPPRRGIGAALCEQIEHSDTRWLIYSSCNPATLIADLQRMPSLAPQQAQLLDMFPHTAHCETLVLLSRV